MKRNYFKPIAATALATIIMLAGGIAFAGSNMENLSRAKSGRTAPEPRKVVSPGQKVRRALGLGNTLSEIKPSTDGMMPTPRVDQRPKKTMRSAENPRGNLYGVVNRYITMELNSDAFAAKIDAKTGSIEPLYYNLSFCPYIGDDYLFQTDAYANGYIYTPAFSQMDDHSVFWYKTNFETGELEGTISFPSGSLSPYSLTYDSKHNRFYILGIQGEKANIFAEVNPENDFRVTELLSLDDFTSSEFFSAIAYCSADERIYAFTNFNNVYRLPDNMEDDPIFVGEIEYDALFTEGETGAICYSPADQAFIAMYPDQFQQCNYLIYINPETWEATEGAAVAKNLKPHFSSVFVTDDYADADAPEIAGVPTFNFEGSNLSGSISFTAPEYTYTGVSLKGTSFRTVVTVDGNSVYDNNVTSGQNLSIPLTLSEGLHQIEIISYIGDKASPVRRASIYTGFDAPTAPTNIVIDGNNLSWDAPTKGANNGYIEFNDISYDVYIDNVKQNAQPITNHEFILTPPAEMGVYTIGVTATVKGKESAMGTISEIFGKALSLPFAQAPTQQEQKLYRRINSNNDERKFVYGTYDNIKHNFVMELGYQNDADDWLVFPLINFPSKDYLYSFKFNVAGVAEWETIESFGIYLAKKPEAKDLLKGINIYSENYYRSSNDQFLPMEINFAVNEPGDYYVGIHVNSTKSVNPSGMGLQFADFDISVCEGKSTILPADPTKVEIIPNETGDTEFDAKVTISTLDIAGNPLPADMDITITVSADGFAQSVTGKPGQTVELNKIPVNGSGFTNISVTPSNDNGKGYTRSHRAYVGIDIPFCPTDIKGSASADNRSITVSWKAPGAIGENGGTVRLDELYYNFYIKNGITFVKINDQPIIDTEYTYTPNNPALSTYYAGPSAVSDGGESVNSIFVMEDLGVPYELPMKEEWNTTGFTYQPAHYLTTGSYAPSSFDNVGSVNGMGLGDPVFEQGGISAFSTFGACDGRYFVPKFTTKGIEKSVFKLRYWDYFYGVNAIQIYGIRYGNDKEVLIGEFKLNKPTKGEWVEAEIALPDSFNDADWVQLYINTHFLGGEKEYLLLDNFEIFPDIDYDMKVLTLDGPTQLSVGDTPSYTVTIANSGRERIGGSLIVEILDNEGNVYASDQTTIEPMVASQISEHTSTFDLTGEIRNADDLIVRATIKADGDQNSANNVKNLPVSMMGSQLPVVSDLKAKVNDDNSVDLSWSTPLTSYGNFTNFETETPFEITNTIGRFSNFDIDKLYPVEIGSGDLIFEWEGSRLPQAWTIVNMEKLGFMNDPRLRPHSGKQVLLARSIMEEDGTVGLKQAADFLVSPRIEPGSNVSWWESTMTTDTEYVEVWYATKDNAKLGDTILGNAVCGDFRKFVSRSKGGDDLWEFIEVTLPVNAKYFALRYSSYDGTAVLIDDLTFTPVEMLEHEIDSYAIYRSENGDEPILVAENITENAFTDKGWNNDFNANYYVLTSAKINDNVKQGPKSNIVFVQATSVDEIPAGASISADYGRIRVDNLAGENLSVATADGKIVINTTVRSNQDYYSLDKGIYVVSAGKLNVKVIVK